MASDVEENSPAVHVPVMPRETLRFLDVKEGQVVVDATAGGGGHLRLLAEAVGPTGRVIATDRDPRAFSDDMAGGVAKQLPGRVTLKHAAFSEIEQVLAEAGVEQVDALLADLGVSSAQLDEGERGFSFGKDAPLDMRMDTSRGETAAELIGRLDEEELANVIYQYGEEPKSRRIARAIKRADPRPTTTGELAEIVSRAAGGRRGRIHPATKTFQALRIAVNGELDELDALLQALPRVVKPGGRAVLISFHSLEDRKVKRCFRGDAGERVWQVLTKRPVEADEDERRRNPRSRSAKLRAAVRAADSEEVL